MKGKEKKLEVDEADVLIVTEPIRISDGKHSGIVTNIVRNMPNPSEGRQFDYLDITVKVTDVNKEPEIKIGFPANLSELSSLGRLLKKAKMEFVEGEQILISDIKRTLINKKVSFLSKNEKTESGEFARILRDTIEFE